MITASLDASTPALTALDPRGLIVREIAYHRSDVASQAMPRITRKKYDWHGRLTTQRDPRLGELAQVDNLRLTLSSSASTLLSESVDAGWRLSLYRESGEPMYAWDGRGTFRRDTHDALGRLTAVTEAVSGQAPIVIERVHYGDAGTETARHNQCGQITRHDDQSGSLQIPDYSMLQSPLIQKKRFCLSLALPDWPEDEGAREFLLEQQEATTYWQFSPSGEKLLQVDARQHTQRYRYNLTGDPDSTFLQIKGSVEEPLTRSIQYNAGNRVERETAGNNVVTRAEYDPCNGRLLLLNSAVSGQPPLQSLRYAYDPVGNVVEISDEATAPVFFRNQRIEHRRTFGYDSLYQLLWSKGFEAINNPVPPLSLASLRKDPGQVTNYHEDYRYDLSGNLNCLVHVGSSQYTRKQVTALGSNQSLEFYGDDIPTDADLRAAYDPNGNRNQLLRGQTMMWNSRNQLCRVTPVSRPDSEDDSEVYEYDSQGERVRKTTCRKSKAAIIIREVRYLPGIELRTDSIKGRSCQVIRAQGGLCGVSVTILESRTPSGGVSQYWSFSLHDHLGSGVVELSQTGQPLSRHYYLPYGGMAWSETYGCLKSSNQALRYSGKERDASGLVYYGLRYYAPWLQRWINPDPAVDIDGLNLYRFVRNNPVTLVDMDGLKPVQLLYGFEHVRTRTINGLVTSFPQQSFVRIDEINDALQINMDNASSDFAGFNEMISEGIEVESDNVDYFMQIAPSYQGTHGEAKALLQSWSNYLKEHTKAFDVTRKIHSYDAATKGVDQFWKKNLRSPLSDQAAQAATSSLRNDPHELFLQRTTDSIAAGDAVINWQFRQLSKLALDWMTSSAEFGVESGVVFLDVIARSPDFVFKEFAQSTFTAKPYKDTAATYGKSYNPITHSERRHLERNMAAPGSNYSRRVKMIDLDRARQLSNI